MRNRSRWAMRAAALCLLLGTSACAGLHAGGPEADAASATQSLDLRLADATLSAGAAGTALHVLNEALQRDPHNVPVLLRKGRALMALGKPGDAARTFALVVTLQPGSLDAMIGLARARAANDENAESTWRLALAKAPHDARVQVGLAISLDLQEHHTEAQALYRAVLARTPDDPAVRSDLGLSLAMSGHATEGVVLLRQAAQGGFGSNSAELGRARNNLAAGLVMAGDEPAAHDVLSQELPPDKVTAALAGLRQFAMAR